MSNDLQRFVREALEAYEQGFSIIAARLNEILDERAPSLQINADPPESGLTPDNTAQRLRDAAQRLRNVLSGLRPYLPDLPDDPYVRVWSLGHINDLNSPPKYVGFVSSRYAVGVDDIEDQFRDLDERGAGWTADRWRKCIVEPVEQYAEEWRALLGKLDKNRGKTPDVVAQSKSKSVLLFGRQDNPIVKDKEKDTLTNAQYDVVLALLKADNKRLTKDKLDRDSKHGDARKILKRLAKSDPDWASVISFPGTTGKGYQIV